jgi:hypothetical protein
LVTIDGEQKMGEKNLGINLDALPRWDTFARLSIGAAS